MKFDIVHLSETDSTNRYCQMALREHTGSNVVVWADYQTAGRGCGTNQWESERGKNLTFSMLIHPGEIKATQQFSISMAISVAIVKGLGKILPQEHSSRLSIKWPNDIYWRDRKLCGILIENHLSGGYIRESVIGIGLNVNQQVFGSDAPNPVSLWQIMGHEVEREEVLREVLAAFTLDVEATRYHALLYRREGFHAYSDAGGLFSARLVTVEPDGHLVLQDDQGQERRYAFKEVAFVHV